VDYSNQHTGQGSEFLNFCQQVQATQWLRLTGRCDHTEIEEISSVLFEVIKTCEQARVAHGVTADGGAQ
jgi:hypothetical protein